MQKGVYLISKVHILGYIQKMTFCGCYFCVTRVKFTSPPSMSTVLSLLNRVTWHCYASLNKVYDFISNRRDVKTVIPGHFWSWEITIICITFMCQCYLTRILLLLDCLCNLAFCLNQLHTILRCCSWNVDLSNHRLLFTDSQSLKIMLCLFVRAAMYNV